MASMVELAPASRQLSRHVRYGRPVVGAAAVFDDAVLHNGPEDVTGRRRVLPVQQDSANGEVFNRLGKAGGRRGRVDQKSARRSA